MEGVATWAWGFMIGSWLTSFVIMHWHKGPAPSKADTMLSDMATRIDRVRLFAPEHLVAAERDILIDGKPYHIKVTPEPL